MFQSGLPLELVTLSPGGELETRTLGDPGDSERPLAAAPDEMLAAGDTPASPLAQALVPAGSWQGARLAGGPHLPASRAWALVSCVVSPGFEYEDFELGRREALVKAFPEHAEIVTAFT